MGKKIDFHKSCVLYYPHHSFYSRSTELVALLCPMALYDFTLGISLDASGHLLYNYGCVVPGWNFRYLVIFKNHTKIPEKPLLVSGFYFCGFGGRGIN